MTRRAKLARAIAFAALALGFASPTAAADWRLHWTTIETPHFSIHYPDGLEPYARHAAVVAEDVHQRVTAWMGWAPRGKTQIVVQDDVDAANGSASVIPYRAIRLLATMPGEDSNLDVYDDWLETLITHEYEHVVHMDMARGVPAALRYVFGRIFSLSAVVPTFMIEGLAVYTETLGTSGGRGRSTTTDMLLRAAVLEKRLQPLSRWTTLSYSTWPAGHYPYEFGGAFHLWIGERYGHRFGEFYRLHAGQIFPWLYNHDAKRIFGKSWYALYREFADDLAARAEGVRTRVEAEGVTPTTRLTTTGERTIQPRFAPNGWYLAWWENSPHHRPRMISYDRISKRAHRLFESDSGAGLSWSPLSDRIAYVRRHPVRIDYAYNDLYLFDRKAKKRIRLTTGARASDPDLAPDYRSIVFVQNHEGASDLALYRFATGKVERLTNNPPLGPQVSAPRFSPDGTRIALSMRADGNRDVYLLDPATRALTRITYDPADDESPCFSPDGRRLFFVSDATGIANVHAFDLEERRLWRVTNVVGGAFTPDVSPDGKQLAFAGYSSRGYDIYVMDLDESTWTPVPYRRLEIAEAGDLGIDEENRAPERPAVASTTHPYRPWATLWPRYWMPWVAAGDEDLLVGARTSGADVLDEHEWNASVFYGVNSGAVNYGVDYANRQTYPTLGVWNSLNQVYFGKILRDGDRLREYRERRLGVGTSAAFPITTQLVATVAYRLLWRDALTPIPASETNPPNAGVFSGVTAGIAYSDADGPAYSVSSERGGSYAVRASVDTSLLGSDYDVQTYGASVSHFVGIGDSHHVFAFSADAGFAEGDRLRQRAFRMGGFLGVYPLGVSTEGRYTLRGFAPSAFLGQRAATATVEYRFPIWWIERGIGLLPFFFERISGTVYADAGSAWDGMWEGRDAVHAGVGANVRLAMLFSYGFPLSLNVGMARGLGDRGIWAWTVMIGSPL
jgi:Tol biopolymer transport system component